MCPPTNTFTLCPRGIIPIRPCVISFMTARITFKASRDILSGPFALLNGPYISNSFKSFMICKTLVNWHQINWWDSSHHHNWWDSSHHHTYLNRQARQVSGHQQDWKDGKLCHDVPSDTAPNRPVEVMIALSLIRNHHHKGQLNTVELFTF